MTNKKAKIVGQSFEHTILAYGKIFNIQICPDEGELFGLTNHRQVIKVRIKVKKNVILIERIK